MRVRYVLFGLALWAVASSASAFEVKGFSPGVAISSIDLSKCERKADVDSGMPGYRCDTTLGGEPASLRLAVFEGKVVAVIFDVENVQMHPMKDALEEKYGKASQSNRYIQDYDWRKGPVQLSIAEKRIKQGYSLMILDFDLLKQSQEQAKQKAKKDF